MFVTIKSFYSNILGLVFLMKPGLSFTRSLKGNNEFGDENLRELCEYDSNQDGGHVIDLVTFGF